jgi:hypothetical protein
MRRREPRQKGRGGGARFPWSKMSPSWTARMDPVTREVEEADGKSLLRGMRPTRRRCGARGPVCFGFWQLLATKSCCGLPNA